METLEIHSKDFLVKWVHVPEDSSIVWQAKPLKKSINFAVYRKKTNSDIESAKADLTESSKPFDDLLHSIQKSSSDLSLGAAGAPRLRSGSVASVNQITELNTFRTKSRSNTFSSNLSNSDLVLIKNHNKLVSNELVRGSIDVAKGTMVAFIFDNSFSKTVSKKVLFSTKIVPHTHDVTEASAGSLNSHVSDANGGSSGTNGSRNILMPKNGELMLSVLLKRRRKKLQGFVKRYFVLNFKYGTLSYFKTNDNKLRGQMPVIDSIISANSKNREIFVDSGMEVWDLKALSAEDFNAWVQAFNTVKSRARSESPADISDSRTVSLAAELERISKSLQSILRHSDEIPHGSLDGKLEDVSRHLQLVAQKQRQAANNEVASVMSHNEFYDAQEHLESGAGGVVIMDALDKRAHSDDEGEDVDAPSVESASSGSDADSESDSDDLPPPTSSVQGGHVATRAVLAEDMDSCLYPLPLDPISRSADVPICKHEPPNLLSFVRKNVGKDLSSISMPVDMNEPLTILQKYAESFEYTELIDNALESTTDAEDTGERILRIAAFATSNLASFRLKVRSTRKPFNPLLGETYELVREDKGYRMVSEKVSHKPPVFAIYVESENWSVSYAAAPSQKFWGKTYEITTKGVVRLSDKKSGEVFTWSAPTSLLKNIIAGEKYTEPSLPITVKSSSGQKAVVEFAKGGMFSGRSEDLTIKAWDARKKQLPDSVVGKWTDSMTLKTKSTERVIWNAGNLLPQAESKYGFTEFAGTLNKITRIEDGWLPPSDSRLRPDMQVYEKGDVEQAEVLKNKLEEDQRTRRRLLEEKGTEYEPRFFKNVSGGAPDSSEWAYISGPTSYWNRRKAQDWSNVEQMW